MKEFFRRHVLELTLIENFRGILNSFQDLRGVLQHVVPGDAETSSA
jgi:hypothetical protein